MSFGKNEESIESISRYVNGLIYAIQDYFNVLNFHSVAKAYQASLRIEEKLLMKQYSGKRSQGCARGKQKEKKYEEGESISSAMDQLIERGSNIDRE